MVLAVATILIEPAIGVLQNPPASDSVHPVVIFLAGADHEGAGRRSDLRRRAVAKMDR